jgi:hypothetical protein
LLEVLGSQEVLTSSDASLNDTGIGKTYLYDLVTKKGEEVVVEGM